MLTSGKVRASISLLRLDRKAGSAEDRQAAILQKQRLSGHVSERGRCLDAP